MINPALYSSAKTGGSDDWQTPECVLEPVRALFGGRIDLDPCTTDDNPTRARAWFTGDRPGPLTSYAGCGNVFVNPPYSEIHLWIERCKGGINRDQVVALVPSRTDRPWFHNAHFNAVCFWKGQRLRFVDPLTGQPSKTGAPFPSALLYWGRKPKEFCFHFGALGKVMFA